MALNWFLTLRNLSKTEPQAAEIMELLKKAETDDEKENAKKLAQEFLQKIQSEQNSTETSENQMVSEPETLVPDENQQNIPENDDTPDTENEPKGEPIADKSTQPIEKKKEITDLSAPAFNPRLARCGITREEELFLHGVFVRKMDREEKILMRRSIYQKKTLVANKIQAEYKAKRIAQKEKDLKDPEKQKFHQERKYVSAIVNALEQHKNLIYIFSNIEGLTVDICKELLKKPGNVNAFNVANPNFVTNFKKMYGE